MSIPTSAGTVVRRARERAGLSLRALATAAGTSHSTLAAYEAGRKTPTVDTLDRILDAAGFAIDRELSPRIRSRNGLSRGEELVQVLELAAQFPARHSSEMTCPVFAMR